MLEIMDVSREYLLSRRYPEAAPIRDNKVLAD